MARLQRLATGAVPDCEDARWLAENLSRYLAEPGAGLDMDTALGLAPTAGAVAWWRARQHAERDSLLCQAADQYPGSTNAKAVQLQQQLKRYAATSWLCDRVSRQPSIENRLIFAVFMADPEPPMSIRRLTDILTSSNNLQSS